MILAITMTRAGSKGVPHKHTRDLGGKPVIAWTLEAVKQAKLVDDYYVSTNDAAVESFAKGWGIPVLRRPDQFCQDTSPTLPGLQWSIAEVERMTGRTYEYIVEVRATSPFKTSADIDNALSLLMRTGADSVIGVTPLEDHHPARIKWLDEHGYLRDFLPEPPSGRRQDLTPKAYIRNGTMYAFRREAVLPPDGKLFGHARSIGYVMPAERSVNIDTELDWSLCLTLLKSETSFTRTG